MNHFIEHVKKCRLTLNPHWNGNTKKLMKAIAKDFFNPLKSSDLSKGEKILLFSDRLVMIEKEKIQRNKN